MNLIEQLKAQAAAKKAAAEAQSAPQAPAPKNPASILAGLRRPVSPASITPVEPEPPSVTEPSMPDVPEASQVSPGTTEMAAAPKLSGLKMPVRRIVGGTPAPVQPAVTIHTPELAAAEEHMQEQTVPAAPKRLVLPGNLGALKANAEARAVGTLRVVGVNPVAAKALDHGPIYSAEDMLAELNDIDAEPIDEDDMEAVAERDNERGRILQKGAHELQRRFENEMANLQVAAASDPSIAEIARIVKLTFMRVKSAPGAWAFLPNQDKAQVIKAMRVMAEKRLSATKSRKKTEAKEYSGAVETMGSPILTDDVAALMGEFGFDLGM